MDSELRLSQVVRQRGCLGSELTELCRRALERPGAGAEEPGAAQRILVPLA